MADKHSKIRDFLWQEARRRPHKFLKGPHKVPNGKALAAAMGVSQPTVSRLLRLKRNLRRTDGHVPDFRVEPAVEAGLMRLSGINTHGELWDAIWNAPPAPDPRGSRKARKK